MKNTKNYTNFMKHFFKSNYITLYSIILFILILNLLLLNNVVIGIIFSILYLILSANKISDIFFKTRKQKLSYFIYSFFLLISVLIIILTGFYYFYKIDIISIIITLLSIYAGIVVLHSKNPTNIKKNRQKKIQIKKSSIVLNVIAFGISITLLGILNKFGTTNTLRSPWEVVPSIFFVLYFLLSFSIITINLKAFIHNVSLVLNSLFYFISSSVAVLVYKLGFGFDPFIHIATEKYIMENGFILPKTFYYIGQYSLTVFLSKITFLPVEVIDKFLLVSLFSLLPFVFYICFKKIIKENYTRLLPLFFLIIPYQYFIVTTPQGLACLFLIIAILSGINYFFNPKTINLVFVTLFSLACFLIHPLAGIPAFVYLMILILFKFNSGFFITKFKKSSITIILLSIFLVPTLFLANSIITNNFTNSLKEFNNNTLYKTITHNVPTIKITTNFNFIYDLTYFWGKNLFWIYNIMVIIGLYLVKKHEVFKHSKIFFISFAVIIINSIILQIFVKFPNLIGYEQQDYSNRLIYFSFYFLLIFFLISYSQIFSLNKKKFLRNIFLTCFTSLLITTSLFFSYPRHNKYETGRGYSISETDIKTVQLIEKEASDKYIVLSNQIVSAAALKEFGFINYYKQVNPESNEEHYFYAIPTGGKLYKYYLDMVYTKTDKPTAKKAGDLVGAKEVFFVINDYWTDFEKIIQNGMATADNYYIIDEGKTYVFRYDF